MPATCSHLDPAIGELTVAVAAGAPTVSGPVPAGELIDSAEKVRRLAAIASVDAMQAIHVSRAFYDHGHSSAAVMWAHISGESGAEAHGLDKIRRMVHDPAIDQITSVWRKAELSVAKAAVLGRAYANPRSRQRFVLDQRALLNKAARWGLKRFEQHVARWIELHDQDGPEPPPDPGHERRDLSMHQDHFSKAWKLEVTLGSLDGSRLNEILLGYIEAEFHKDWNRAEKIHGTETCMEHLARTPAQRRADALVQMAEDAAQSDKPSAPVERVHNIICNAETVEEMIRRTVNAPARILDPDSYQICDIDGHPIDLGEAFADMLVSSFRRVVKDAQGVIIGMSKPTRFFTGLARLGVKLTTTECYWPGCHVPTSRCQIDHLKPAARGGPTTQLNGLPACKRHNRFKERGYTVTRCQDGNITITTPTGETIR